MQLTASPRAIDELKRAIEARSEAEGTAAIRVMVQSQCGCGTSRFAMGFDEPDDDDNRIDLGGVTVLVDPNSAPFLDQAKVDYSDDLMGQGFRIEAPQTGGGGCGCGGGGHGGHGHQH